MGCGRRHELLEEGDDEDEASGGLKSGLELEEDDDAVRDRGLGSIMLERLESG